MLCINLRNPKKEGINAYFDYLLNLILFNLEFNFLSSKCGERKVKNSTNGKLKWAGKWPWVAVVAEDDEEKKHLCGATLINEWTLVTSK